MIRDLLPRPVFMSTEPEPPRLHLGNLWPDDDKDADSSGVSVTSAWKAAASQDRPLCGRCAGELVRSRLRGYERVVTFFTKARPYRCLDCRARRWR